MSLRVVDVEVQSHRLGVDAFGSYRKAPATAKVVEPRRRYRPTTGTWYVAASPDAAADLADGDFVVFTLPDGRPDLQAVFEVIGRPEVEDPEETDDTWFSLREAWDKRTINDELLEQARRKIEHEREQNRLAAEVAARRMRERKERIERTLRPILEPLDAEQRQALRDLCGSFPYANEALSRELLRQLDALNEPAPERAAA